MTEFLSTLSDWHWLSFGIILIVFEVLVPGTFLLWPGLAAVIVGLLKAVIPVLAWTICVSLWAVLSVVLVAGFVLYSKAHPGSRPVSLLNRRGEQYIGERFTLDKPVINGKGEMRVGDTVWKIVSNQDLRAGTVVFVTAVEGTSLRVMPAENA
ncbi:MAG: rane protein implicated in regulation of rane protease [Micavibrio sp.]|nr:rane protein implicated in regulation of rane protease [Micavibrio sp.]